MNNNYQRAKRAPYKYTLKLSHSLHILSIQIETKITSITSNCPYLQAIWNEVVPLWNVISYYRIARYARVMTFKKIQGLGQCLGGHHKLVKNSLFLTNWSPVLLEKRHLFRTFHSLQFCCLVVASLWLKKIHVQLGFFIVTSFYLGHRGSLKPPKRILSFMAFFSTLNWIIDEQLEEHFLWLPSFKYGHGKNEDVLPAKLGTVEIFK